MPARFLSASMPTGPDYATMRAGYDLVIPEAWNYGFDLVDRRAREADKEALVWVDRGGGTVERYSFSDISRASSRFANVLLELGVGRGDFAVVVIPRIPAWFEVMVGCMKAGVVGIPGTNLLTAKDLEYRIRKSGARLAIVTSEHAGKIEAIRDACPTLGHLIVVDGAREGWVSREEATARAADTLDPASLPPSRTDDMMMAYFTSGTTARPKMVPRDHGYALAHAITGRYWMDLRDTDVHWTLSDTGWAKAAWGMLFSPWLMGASVVIHDAGGFDADFHLKLVARLRVTTFCAPPTIFRMFAQLDLGQYDLTSIRHSISAGEPLNPEVIRVWQGATGTTVHDGYGQTETVNIVANFPCMEVRPGSMGRPVPGLDVDIVDDDGAVCPEGEVGHIAMRTGEPWPPGLFHGYYDDGAANAGCFRHGWYYTGDTGTRDADGYIWFVGRSDDIISSSGYRISPFEVESALIEHPAVAEAAVVGRRDALRGEVVRAYVTLAPGQVASDDLAAGIQDFVKNLTAPYKYPREIVFREALPKTISGKIRRVELRAEANAEAGDD